VLKSPGGQGTRNDILDLKSDIDAGKDLDFVMDHHFGLFLKYPSGIKETISRKKRSRDFMTEVYIFHGVTRTGKSLSAHQLALVMTDGNADDIYYQEGGKWWDGYTGQQVVIVEDFAGSWSYEQWKRICDRYPVTVERKGGMMKFVSRAIIFTSNIHWMDWWKDLSPSRSAEIQERCHNITYFSSLNLSEDGWWMDVQTQHGKVIPLPFQGLGRPWDK